MTDQPTESVPTTPIRASAICLGLLLIPVNVHWVVAMGQFRKSGDPTTTSLFFNAVFTLLVLELLNYLVRRLAPRLAFNRLERLTIYTLVAGGCGVASRDWMQVALSLWGYPHWHATPENNWAGKFLSQIPFGLTVTDLTALEGYFQGHSTLYTERHIRAWLPPVLYWCSFFTVVQLVMLSVNVILRRQWTEREKLSFPILQVPLEITAPGRETFGKTAFWIGFGLAASINIVNGLNAFIPQIPFINVKMQNLQPHFTAPHLRQMGFTPVSFFPFVIGLAYLLPSDLSFSCWVFYLFFKAQLAFGAWLGFDASMGFDGKQGSMPFVNEQGIGAYLAYGLFALYAARHHLAEVWRRLRQPVDAQDRLYRWAVVGLVFGLCYWLLFASYCGFPWALALAYFGLYFLVTTTITKIRAELGPPVHDLHFGGPDRMLLTWVGVQQMAPTNRLGMAMFFGFNRAYRGVPQPFMLEGMKAAEVLGGSQRRMTVALALAAPVAAFSAAWAMLHWAYLDGMQFSREAYRLGGQAWTRLDSWYTQAWPAGLQATLAMGVGGLICLSLMALRLRHVGFPFHPIGYAISANWAMNCVWMPILIGWALKVMALRAGGARSYRAGIPVAIGLIVGEFVVGGLWSLYGVIGNVPVYQFWLF